MVPKNVFYVKGTGYHYSKLISLEQALRSAGIEKYNLVKVTSILPPNCIEISKDEGLKKLAPGQIVYAVLSYTSSDKKDQACTTSIGVAKPKNQGEYGYFSEYQAFDELPERVGAFAEKLAAEMLATALGVQFDADVDYDEKQEIYKMNGKIVESKNITESAVVRKDGEWCTALAAAIFIL
jgi:arginine decarboxylase